MERVLEDAADHLRREEVGQPFLSYSCYLVRGRGAGTYTANGFVMLIVTRGRLRLRKPEEYTDRAPPDTTSARIELF